MQPLVQRSDIGNRPSQLFNQEFKGKNLFKQTKPANSRFKHIENVLKRSQQQLSLTRLPKTRNMVASQSDFR